MVQNEFSKTPRQLVRQMSVAIIGAGITGLTAAFYLKRQGIPVTVYEASARVGGVIQSLRQDGFLAEFGPNTLLETSPRIGQFVRDAGLQSRRLDPDPKASARYVVRYQRPIAMPGSPLGFFSTELFSLKAKLAVLREPFVPRRRDGVEESIAQFVVRRFNQEFLDHAIDALVAGIYAGDPYKLSVAHAFPKLKALEDDYGSMIRGQIFGARARKRRGEVAKDRAPKFSFDDGLQVLTDTLAQHLKGDLRCVCKVLAIEKKGSTWLVRGRAKGTTLETEHRAVLFTSTSYAAPEIRLSCDGQALDWSALGEIKYPPVASLVLGFKRADVTHPCEGFGMLIPKIEGFKILGTIFSSSLFPNRAPTGHLTLTSYVGGERYPELASLPQDKLVELVCEDLRVLLGVRDKPVFAHSVFYPRAIPQYNIGYGHFKQLMNDVEAKAPGFFFAGHYRDGISLSDSIVSGCKVVERVASFLSH